MLVGPGDSQSSSSSSINKDVSREVPDNSDEEAPNIDENRGQKRSLDEEKKGDPDKNQDPKKFKR